MTTNPSLPLSKEFILGFIAAGTICLFIYKRHQIAKIFKDFIIFFCLPVIFISSLAFNLNYLKHDFEFIKTTLDIAINTTGSTLASWVSAFFTALLALIAFQWKRQQVYVKNIDHLYKLQNITQEIKDQHKKILETSKLNNCELTNDILFAKIQNNINFHEYYDLNDFQFDALVERYNNIHEILSIRSIKTASSTTLKISYEEMRTKLSNISSDSKSLKVNVIRGINSQNAPTPPSKSLHPDYYNVSAPTDPNQSLHDYDDLLKLLKKDFLNENSDIAFQIKRKIKQFNKELDNLIKTTKKAIEKL